jgi:putative ABC transport system substrate-binding protein
MIGRRDFITLLGSAAAWPLAARAQQQALPVIGYLGDQTLESRRDRVSAFHRGLADIGYVEGRNVTIEYRWAEGHNERLGALADELVRRQVAVIAAPGSLEQALAAKAATQTIPIVFVIGGDPVKSGLVASLARPGANITGTTALSTETISKRLEVLHELLPAAALIALLVDPTNPLFTEIETREAQLQARALGLRLLVLNAAHQDEFPGAFNSLVQQGAGALLVSSETLFTAQRERIVALAARHAVPAIFHYREVVETGGLISYGGNVLEVWRQAGVYTGRILRGEKPADLPVQQATKIELVINLKTAKALGLTVPLPLLARADEVIE